MSTATPTPTAIPSAVEVRVALRSLTWKQLEKLAELSESPLPTLVKLRYGSTPNPGVETVRRFWPWLELARKEG